MVFEAMLELLDKNKLMPYYAAERRIDLFINLFLEEILTAYYGEKVNFVVAEFPLKHALNNQADKLDYLCAFNKTKQPIFVELKTDSISFKCKQAAYYIDRATHWPSCIEGLMAIIGNKKMRFSYREKYFQLMTLLLNNGLIDISGEGTRESFQRLTALAQRLNSRGEKGEFSRRLIELSRHIHARRDGEAKLLYLVPDSNDVKIKIERECKLKYPTVDFSRIDTLEFLQIESLPIDSDMNYAQEFRQLVKFLKTLK